MLKRYFQKCLDQKVSRGVVVVDKEAGITSHDEVDRLRRIFGTRRVGHSGTLDPKVTGVLVCGLGRGTKVLEYVLLSEKIYDAEIVFHKSVDQIDFKKVLQEYRGVITQLPPVKSRVKRVEREREIYQLELLNFASDGRSARLRSAVERGTYIRKLCHDIGESLGTGAHMGELRRIKAGPVDERNLGLATTGTLQSIKSKSSWPFIGWWYTRKLASYIQPIELILKDIPTVEVSRELAHIIASGSPLYGPGVVVADERIESGDLVVIEDDTNQALAIGIAGMTHVEMNQQQKGVAVKITKVLQS